MSKLLCILGQGRKLEEEEKKKKNTALQLDLIPIESKEPTDKVQCSAMEINVA